VAVCTALGAGNGRAESTGTWNLLVNRTWQAAEQGISMQKIAEFTTTLSLE
jgi:hypothetical protein